MLLTAARGERDGRAGRPAEPAPDGIPNRDPPERPRLSHPYYTLPERTVRVCTPALGALEAHLVQLAILMRHEQLQALRRVTIQVDLDHPLRNLQYHPSRGWLEANGYDPELTRCVHVPRAASLTDRDLHAVQPRVILHELAHAYHDQVLGFDHREVLQAFGAAVEGGQYEEVLHVKGHRTRHYALTNHKEYFAEGTEAYFGANDFHPFVRAELKSFDPELHGVLREVWGPLP